MSTPTLEQIYKRHLERQHPTTLHLPRLRALAEGLELVVEFGVRIGASSSALLMGAAHVISFDIEETPQARELESAAPHWDYRLESSLETNPIVCDGLFVDSFHTYEQCRGELQRHADNVRGWIAFHDTLTFGSVGGIGNTGQQMWDYGKHRGQTVPPEFLGIRPAIDELMIRDSSWRIEAHYLDAHGMLVLRRVR